MAKAKKITASLPPRHGGYRAVREGGRSSAAGKNGRPAPQPPSGKGGGSKS